MESYLSFTRDDFGQIVSASGVSITWMGHINRSNIEIPDSLFEAGLPVREIKCNFCIFLFQFFFQIGGSQFFGI